MVVHDTEVVGLAAHRVLFEHCADGVLFALPDGRVTAANPAACALLDLSADEICRLGLDGLADAEDPRWRLALAERDRTGSSIAVVRLRRGDGRHVELEASSRLFHDESGAVRVLTVLRDATSRLAFEREIEELSAQLLQLARDDELTGFHNRRGLLASGTALLQHADRTQAEVRALFVDVGNVQGLNERLGHQAGDAALQAVARALSVAFRRGDVLARLAGTQFLVLALDLPAHDCDAVTGRILDHVGSPETIEFVGGPVELAFGWTTRPVGDPSSLEELVARSDWAMLEARDARAGSAPA
jgi:diguanylate cyclase (GGDEF)-like protein/PAS domain S-box-containing protein